VCGLLKRCRSSSRFTGALRVLSRTGARNKRLWGRYVHGRFVKGKKRWLTHRVNADATVAYTFSRSQRAGRSVRLPSGSVTGMHLGLPKGSAMPIGRWSRRNIGAASSLSADLANDAARRPPNRVGEKLGWAIGRFPLGGKAAAALALGSPNSARHGWGFIWRDLRPHSDSMRTVAGR
jgi:hypothetical protein